ncbi:MAG: hypothetical protein HC859_15710 [Bacteroidia bacterium]|nr:hypothetical protein [Bacteroidia bacterium]
MHYYQKTLELNPTNATVHYKIADVLARGTHQDDLTHAAVSIEEALRLEQHNKYIYILAASIFSSLTQFDKAAEAYENMIKQVPGCEEYLYELAAVYQYGNRFEDAIKTYKSRRGCIRRE